MLTYTTAKFKNKIFQFIPAKTLSAQTEGQIIKMTQNKANAVGAEPKPKHVLQKIKQTQHLIVNGSCFRHCPSKTPDTKSTINNLQPSSSSSSPSTTKEWVVLAAEL